MTNTTAINTTSLFLDEGDKLTNGATVLAVVVTDTHKGSDGQVIEDGFLLARRDVLAERGFVTWAYKAIEVHGLLPLSGRYVVNTFWGHYDMRFFDAVKDLAERVHVEL